MPGRGRAETWATCTSSFGERWADEEVWGTGRFDFLLFAEGFDGGADTLVDPVTMLSTVYIGFRGTGPPFDDERVRKAFAHGADRERVARLGGRQVELAARGGVIPPAMPGYSHRVGLEHDVELARRLLAEAGYPGGRGLPPLTIYAVAANWRAGGAEDLVRQWSHLGAQVELKALPFSEVQKAVGDGTADAWLWGWIADLPDPHGILDGLLESTPLYRDPEIVDLLARARSGVDQAERMRLYREVERLLIAERAAIIPVGYVREAVVRRPQVEGLWATPLSKASLDEIVVRRPT